VTGIIFSRIFRISLLILCGGKEIFDLGKVKVYRLFVISSKIFDYHIYGQRTHPGGAIMKKIFLPIAAFLLFVGFNSNLYAQTITVAGAGSTFVNGQYTYESDYLLKGVYRQVGGASCGISWTGTAWNIRSSDGLLYYYLNSADTQYPPSGGWQVDANGSANAPTLTYEIATLSDLNWLSQTSSVWGNAFKQTADINASATSSQDGGNGFIPIGNVTTKFTGTYDGQIYKIDSLYIDRSTTDEVGLFGYVTDGATVTNVKLENVDITGEHRVGGLIGYQYRAAAGSACTVTNCYVTGSITAGNNTGGLIGFQQNASVSRSYSSASVSGGRWVGGLIGEQYSDNDIAFLGSTYCTDCYSTGAVSGSSYSIGGLIGWVRQNSSITNCYSTGTVAGAYSIGGLIGIFGGSGNSVTSCFWDSTYPHLSYGVDDGDIDGVTAKDSTEMKTDSTFLNAGWSGAIWNIGDGINDGYPYLKWQNPGGTPLPVEMTSFIATSDRSGAHLVWRTATEQDCHGFEVERRRVTSDESRQEAGGQVRVTSWEKISFVSGNGTTNAPHEYSFADVNVPSGRYAYRLKQIDINGAFKYYGAAEIEIAAPAAFTLVPNYPNPFNPATTFSFSLPSQSLVSLKVFDALGREVAVVLAEEMPAGSYSRQWNAAGLPSGIYFYRLQTGNFVQTQKMVILK